VVGRPTVGVLERPYGLDRPYRPRVRRLGGLPVLQRREERELVRLRVLVRCRLSPSGRRGQEGSKGPVTRAAKNQPSHALVTGVSEGGALMWSDGGRVAFFAVMIVGDTVSVGHRYLAALGLVDDPDYQGNDEGYDQHPEQQHEQHAEEATAHHTSAHHAASTECRDGQ
jgi:hypothetical protein